MKTPVLVLLVALAVVVAAVSGHLVWGDQMIWGD
jgi:hypothetical protein